MKKIRVSAVNYLNARPFIFGLKNSKLPIDLVLDSPSVAARKLSERSVDVALAPVTVIPELDNHFLLSDYCIGSRGAVRSVCIRSEVPMEQISRVYLDPESRASVALCKILFKEYWGREVTYLDGHPGYENQIGGKTAGLIIGDRAIRFEGKHKYSWDLGEAWQKHTGLDFVFAAWVSRTDLSPDFKFAFGDALGSGLAQLDKVISLEKPGQFSSGFDILDYFTRNISYDLDDSKRKGMELFLNKIEQRAASPI